MYRRQPFLGLGRDRWSQLLPVQHRGQAGQPVRETREEARYRPRSPFPGLGPDRRGPPPPVVQLGLAGQPVTETRV